MLQRQPPPCLRFLLMTSNTVTITVAVLLISILVINAIVINHNFSFVIVLTLAVVRGCQILKTVILLARSMPLLAQLEESSLPLLECPLSEYCYSYCCCYYPYCVFERLCFAVHLRSDYPTETA